jgi:hypothetical protein
MTLVRKKIESFSIVAGNPCRKVGTRDRTLLQRLEVAFHEETRAVAKHEPLPASPRDLVVYVMSWRRAGFLRQTLESLRPLVADLDADVVAIDNGSGQDVIEVLEAARRLRKVHHFPQNLGINAALEAAIPEDLPKRYRHVLISADDMQYRESPQIAMNFLASHPEIGAVSFQHSPEHEASGQLTDCDRHWPLKATERGCSLLARTEDLSRVRPLPVNSMRDFDWWFVRDAPASLTNRKMPVAVLAGGALHLGWRKGDSPWQPQIEIPEYPEYRL